MIRWTDRYYRKKGDAEPTRTHILTAPDDAAARREALEGRRDGEEHVEVEEGPVQFRTDPSFTPSPD